MPLKEQCQRGHVIYSEADPYYCSPSCIFCGKYIPWVPISEKWFEMSNEDNDLEYLLDKDDNYDYSKIKWDDTNMEQLKAEDVALLYQELLEGNPSEECPKCRKVFKHNEYHSHQGEPDFNEWLTNYRKQEEADYDKQKHMPTNTNMDREVMVRD